MQPDVDANDAIFGFSDRLKDLRARLRRFVDEHRGPMLELLSARGVQPIAVERRAP